MSSKNNSQASSTTISELAKLFYDIHKKLYGDPDLSSLIASYLEKRDSYLKDHESLERLYPDPELRLNKFESLLRSHAKSLHEAEGSQGED